MIQPVTKPIVQKYGGSSLSNLDKVRTVAEKIIRSADGCRPVVVVVSAMGDTTSELIGRARAVSPSPPRRELDVLLSSGERMSMALLAMAIEEAGRDAVSLTGPQSGIVTDDEHTDATILEVRPDRVSRELEAGRIVVVAGYQGLGTAGEVTTLGRGGSDTTAVALAGALDAARCEIYSDVPGVYTADPRIVEEAVHLKHVDARLMAEYAIHGARVLHPACVGLAHRHRVPVHAMATFGDGTRTVISGEADVEFSLPVSGTPDVLGVTSRGSRLRVRDCGDPAASYEALRNLGDAGSLVLRSRSTEGEDFLVDIDDLPDPEEFTARLKERLPRSAIVTENLASVSIVATTAVTGTLLTRIEGTLGAAEVLPRAMYPRTRSITCALSADQRRHAVRVLHEALIEEPMAAVSV